MSAIPIEYPLVIRVIKGYIEVSQPDLEIYRVRGKFDDIRHGEQIGSIILEVWKEVSSLIAKGNVEKAPSQPKHCRAGVKPEVMTTNEVGALLGVMGQTVRRMCRSGKLDCYTTEGGHLRIRVTDPIVSRFLGEKNNP